MLGKSELWNWFWSDVKDPLLGNQLITVQTPMGLPAVFFRDSSEYAQLFRDVAKEFALKSK